MTVITTIPLADGPLILQHAHNERVSKIAAMAHVLIDKGCFADYGDSIKVLVEADRWAPIEIYLLIDDARHVAREYAAAMEMAWS